MNRRLLFILLITLLVGCGSTKAEKKTNALWTTFIASQVLSAGHINYQQVQGYRELNPIYGSHPNKQKVYAIKAMETIGIYGLTKLFPKQADKILIGSNTIVFGCIVTDTAMGVKFGVSY